MLVNRRNLLAGIAGLMPACARDLAAAAKYSDSGHTVRIGIDERRTLGRIPPDFVGFGYEISSVAIPGLLSANNRTYVQLLRTLSNRGVIRIGGNTSDYSSFDPNGRAVSSIKSTVVNTENLKQLATFLNAAGWSLIWALNLGSGSEQEAVAESRAVAAEVKDKLLAFEIGNEPDLFFTGTAHRSKDYGYEQYVKEYRQYKTAIRAQLPDAPFAGPDVASATDWVPLFAVDEGKDLKLLTHHYYRECVNPTSNLDKLLHPDPKLAPELEKLRTASEASNVPYRICEMNSFCGGGKPGVSDTFGAALWLLDFMFTLAYAACAGVNIETGVNQLGFVSSYSPIAQDESGAYSARPPYYGMLAFAQASQGELVHVDCDAADVNLSAYATKNDRRLSVTMINKDTSRNADVAITITGRYGSAKALRLIAPSLDSKAQITLGGASVSLNGQWQPTVAESSALASNAGRSHIRVPAGSAAILRFET